MFNLDDYTTAQERIDAFWTTYPNGRIATEILEATAHRFIVKASIFATVDDIHALSTGLAQEEIGSSNINKNFALENCETSALARCCANANIGVDKKNLSKTRPSREEMQKVQAVQQKESLIADTKKKMADTSKEYVPIAKEDDPWTIREAAPVGTIDDAVNTVKDIIGTASEIPNCPSCDHPMVWSTGTAQKTGRSWGKFGCNRAVGSGICKQVIWYEISPNGNWQPQKARA